MYRLCILEVLDGFGRTNGLLINIDKTQLMVVGGDDWEVGSRINGIEVVSKVKNIRDPGRQEIGKT